MGVVVLVVVLVVAVKLMVVTGQGRCGGRRTLERWAHRERAVELVTSGTC